LRQLGGLVLQLPKVVLVGLLHRCLLDAPVQPAVPLLTRSSDVSLGARVWAQWKRNACVARDKGASRTRLGGEGEVERRCKRKMARARHAASERGRERGGEGEHKDWE
jgi:hypothetical protein